MAEKPNKKGTGGEVRKLSESIKHSSKSGKAIQPGNRSSELFGGGDLSKPKPDTSRNPKSED